jgi:ADP-ribose pyrophosphatase
MKKYTNLKESAETVSSKNVYDGYMKMDVDTIKTKKGATITREVVRRGKAVCALVFDKTEKKYIFTKQYRPGSKSEMIEVVAGMLESGENPESTMKREIMEEVGYKVDSCVSLGGGFLSPGGSSEYMHCFYVTVSKQVTEGGGLEEEHEEIEVLKMTLQEVKNFKFEDIKTMYCIAKVIK